MKITVQQLMRAVPSTNRQVAAELVAVFNEWSERFGINTPARVTHFMSQVFEETGALSRLVENMNYSKERLLQIFPRYFTQQTAAAYARKPEKIASRVYANRYGNGSEASGDGWKYRGRGLMQLTFKNNYEAYQKSGFCVGNLLAHPEWLAKAPGHTKSAMWYWMQAGCNKLADLDTGQRVEDGEAVVKKITKVVNGGYNNLATRLYYYRLFRKEFGL